jgi:pyridoxine 5-phosphate synthase
VLTSNAGWNLKGKVAWLSDVLKRLHDHGIRTSLFLDPDPEQVRRAKDIGTDRIELYTERYARMFGTPEKEHVFTTYHQAALAAQEVGLGLNAGHDLNLDNLSFFVQNIPGLLEVSIGHALICDALDMGLCQAVKAYLRALGYQA